MRRCWKDMIEEITSAVRSGRMSAINLNPEGIGHSPLHHAVLFARGNPSAIETVKLLIVARQSSLEDPSFFLHQWIWLLKCVCSFANLTVFLHARNIGRMWTQKPIQPATFATLHWQLRHRTRCLNWKIESKQNLNPLESVESMSILVIVVGLCGTHGTPKSLELQSLCLHAQGYSFVGGTTRWKKMCFHIHGSVKLCYI